MHASHTFAGQCKIMRERISRRRFGVYVDRQEPVGHMPFDCKMENILSTLHRQTDGKRHSCNPVDIKSDGGACFKDVETMGSGRGGRIFQ